MDLKYDLDGYGLTMKVYEDYCVINSKKSIASFAMGKALNGSKEIYFKDVTSVQYKKAGFISGNGFIQFEYAGGFSRANSYASENTFIFAKGVNDLGKIEEAYEYIRERVKYYKDNPVVTTVNAVSSADELKKFKGLLDEGIISQEEFDKKKKELLGI